MGHTSDRGFDNKLGRAQSALAQREKSTEPPLCRMKSPGSMYSALGSNLTHLVIGPTLLLGVTVAGDLSPPHAGRGSTLGLSFPLEEGWDTTRHPSLPSKEGTVARGTPIHAGCWDKYSLDLGERGLLHSSVVATPNPWGGVGTLRTVHLGANCPMDHGGVFTFLKAIVSGSLQIETDIPTSVTLPHALIWPWLLIVSRYCFSTWE